ncbi:hypothetical protein LIP_2294 [Limnochorda pilosa]|uniref:Uncharacterized protein n=1 Tax=Limnochorda pilosa TaxID=1555112 RepID=A0A0K2SM04_LIMPI|nr:hypothetical protein LIP_2294 [Limnochorda pilosa]
MGRALDDRELEQVVVEPHAPLEIGHEEGHVLNALDHAPPPQRWLPASFPRLAPLTAWIWHVWFPIEDPRSCHPPPGPEPRQHDSFEAALRRYLGGERQELLDRLGFTGSRWVFVGVRGRQMSVDELGARFHQIARLAGRREAGSAVRQGDAGW